MTAAIYAARAALSPVVLQGLEAGGQLTITTDVENYPGFADVIQGPWLMEQMAAQARQVGAALVADSARRAELGARPFRVAGESGKLYTADALIIATGAQAKWLGLESEEKYKGFGVSACATCDGFFYRDKEVLVVGGGNTAVEEALFLTKFARRVRLIHRRASLRADKILQERLFAHEKIEVIWNTVLEEVLGETGQSGAPGVCGARVRDVASGQERRIKLDGIFIAIGHVPQTAMFRGQLEMDAGGVLATAPGSAATGIAGVYAAGDVADGVYRQAVTAAGMGCMAALEVEKFLSG